MGIRYVEAVQPYGLAVSLAIRRAPRADTTEDCESLLGKAGRSELRVRRDVEQALFRDAKTTAGAGDPSGRTSGT